MKTIFYLLTVLSSFSLSAQNYKSGYNRIGLQGEYLILNLNNSDFEVKPGSGFLAGFSQRGGFYNNFDVVYGISFLQASIAVSAIDEYNTNPSYSNQEVSYTTTGAQLKFLASYLISDENLSLEFGPVLQVNSRLKLDDATQEAYLIEGYSKLKTASIQEWSRVNGLLLAGFTAGFNSVRIIARYQYGLTNALHKLNKENLEEKDPAAKNIKGNLSLITAGIVFYL